MKKQGKKAFTLIELIVVITILAILGTISMMAMNGYSAKARDSVRTSELRSIEKGLEVSQIATGNYPMPDSSISITDGSTPYIFQGNVGDLVTGIIGGTDKFEDPLDKKPYTYIVNKARNKYRLVGIYENNTVSLFNNTAYADETPERTFVFYGNDLAYYTDANNTPIEQDSTLQTAGSLLMGDLKTGNYKFVGKGGTINNIADSKGVGTSCKSILDVDISKKDQDGVYTLLLKNGGVANFWCDMTTEGGGWTILAKTGKQTSDTVDAECSADASITNLNSEDSDYLVHCDLGQTEFLVNQPSDGYVVGTSFAPGDAEDKNNFGSCALNATKTGVNNCDYSHKDSNKRKTFKLTSNGVGSEFNFNLYRMWGEGINYKYNSHAIYDIVNNYTLPTIPGQIYNGIGNWGNNRYRDKSGGYGFYNGITEAQAKEGKFGYIGVR